MDKNKEIGEDEKKWQWRKKMEIARTIILAMTRKSMKPIMFYTEMIQCVPQLRYQITHSVTQRTLVKGKGTTGNGL